VGRPDGSGLSRAHVTRVFEDSLRRLQVETIDLYQTHWPDEKTPMEETFAVFGELVASGKVRHIGVSNYTTSQLMEAYSLGDKSLPRFVSLQPHYNLVWREEYESRKMQFCADNGIAVIPYSPLEGGFLSGKYKRGEKPPKTPRSYGARKFMTEDGFAVTDALRDMASEKGVSISAVAIAWLVHRPAVTAPIIGANSPAQLADLLPASELSLSDTDIQRLNAASEPFTHAQPS
jgi:aryl-alcohol dehydrogenase-like predicted oxidoreductase